jgi:phosphatidylglycerol:prolipoprotein diacylglycerol transferase
MLPYIELFGQRVYLYPLIVGLSWGLVLNIAIESFERNKIKLFLFWLGNLLFGWFGAKLLFLIVLHYRFQNIKISGPSFWLGGGFVFYGGLLACLVFSLSYLHFAGEEFKSRAKTIVPLIPLGHGVGRIGCLMAGCCHGEVLKSPWWVFSHFPVPLIETLGLFILYRYLKKKEPVLSLPGLLTYYLVSYGMIRFILEFFRSDQIRGHWGPMSTSQIISLGLILSGLVFLLMKKRNQNLI